MSASININKSLNWTFVCIRCITLNGKWAKKKKNVSVLSSTNLLSDTRRLEFQNKMARFVAPLPSSQTTQVWLCKSNKQTLSHAAGKRQRSTQVFFGDGKRRNVWVFNPGSVRREDVTRPPAWRWPTRSSPPAWRPASPCTDSWRSGKHRRGNTATRDGRVSVCAAVGRRGDGEKEEYSHFHRQISACSSVAFSHCSPPPTPRQDRRCYTNTPQVTI